MADGVRIDPVRVGDFASDLRAEAGKDFSAAAAQGAGLRRNGVGFGDGLQISDILSHAAGLYEQALHATEANVREYRQAAKVLADAADRIAAEFSAADLRSGQGVQRVETVMNNAILEVQRLSRVQGPRVPGTESI